MSANSSQQKSLAPLAIALGLLSAAVLGMTLYVFNTNLNPGLPLVLAGVLAVVVGLARAVFGAGRYYLPSSDLVTVLLAWLAVSTYFSIDTYLSSRSLATFTGGVAFFLACMVGVRKRRHWRYFVNCLQAVCAIASVHAWALSIAAAQAKGRFEPLTGTFVNPDTFAVLPMIGLCLSMGMVEKAKEIETYLQMALTTLFLATMLATGCRSAMLGFGCGAVFFLFFLFRYAASRSEKTKIFIGFPLILTVLILPVLGYESSKILTKWTNMLETETSTVEATRIELLFHGWKAVAKSPLTGSGPGAFGLQYQTVRPPNHDELYINIAHNDFLEMAVEAGLPGLALWVALNWLAISRLLPLIYRGRRPTEAAGVCAGIVSLGVFSLFNFILVQRPAQWAELWLLGLAFTLPTSRFSKKESPAARVASAVLLLGLGLWTSSFGYAHLQADQKLVQAQIAEQQLRLGDSAVLYDQARLLMPGRSEQVIREVDLLEKIRLFDNVDNQKPQLEILRDTVRRSPQNVEVLAKLAQRLQSFGQLEEANAVLSEAYRLTPYSHLLYEKRLKLLADSAQYGEAARLVSEWAGAHPDAQSTLSAVLLAAELEQAGQGVEVGRKWLEQNPKNTEPLQGAARLAEAAKRPQIQQRFLLLVSEHNKEDMCLRLDLAGITGKLSGTEEEFRLLDEARKADTGADKECTTKLMKRWANLGLKLGLDNKVETGLDDFLKSSPTNSWALVERSRLVAKSGKPEEAIKMLRKALERKPSDVALIFGLAQLYEEAGMTSLAINYYSEVVQADPKNNQAKSRLSKLLKKR